MRLIQRPLCEVITSTSPPFCFWGTGNLDNHSECFLYRQVVGNSSRLSFKSNWDLRYVPQLDLLNGDHCHKLLCHLRGLTRYPDLNSGFRLALSAAIDGLNLPALHNDIT